MRLQLWIKVFPIIELNYLDVGIVNIMLTPLISLANYCGRSFKKKLRSSAQTYVMKIEDVRVFSALIT